MRTFLLTLAVTAGWFGIAAAQTATGTYKLSTSNGAITLVLEEQGGDSISGTLVGDDGISFRVQGTIQNDQIRGTVANPNGVVAAIQGGLLDSGVRFYLIPLDASGGLNHAAAQEFVMDREDSSVVRDDPPRNGANPGKHASSGQSEITGSLTGTYSGDIAGTPATLVLREDGVALSGQIDASGYRYTLSGTARGNAAEGTLADPQAGADMPFEISLQGEALSLTLLSTDPFSGQVQRVPFEFARSGASPGGLSGAQPGAGRSASGDENRGGGPGTEANVERDPALIGSWSHSDTYISGDFSATTRLFMQVNQDGTYVHGSGGVSASLDNVLGSVYGNTGNRGNETRGYWRTQSGVVYIKEAGSPQWIPYARYYVEGNSMMFTFGDGKRQLWQRR